MDDNKNELTTVLDDLYLDTTTNLEEESFIQIPVKELEFLGNVGATLLPQSRKITTTIKMEGIGLYTVANASKGDVLKQAKTGEYYGALKTVNNTSKMAKFNSVDSVDVTSITKMPVDPTTFLVAATLYSIEKDLGEIKEKTKEILDFLEIDKESEMKADVQTLGNIIKEYKFNCDNETFKKSYHKEVIDIQKTALKNNIFYKTQVNKLLDNKQFEVTQMGIQKLSEDLEKKIHYYNLTLYTYAFALLLEAMLCDNYKEEYLMEVKSRINSLTKDYRVTFDKCSKRLEKLSKGTLDTNILKGIGIVTKKAGDAIGAIPLINKGPVDDFLQDSGKKMQKTASKEDMKSVKSFATLSNPKTGMIMDKLDAFNTIYNHTNQISFDEDNIYLVNKKRKQNNYMPKNIA